MSKAYAIKKKRARCSREKELVEEITEKESQLAEGQTTVYEELESLKSEYDLMQIEKAQGAIIRSKAASIEYGEKNTKFFTILYTSCF